MTTREATRAYWKDHVNAWRASGQTQRHYCRLNNLKSHQLTYWIKICGDHTPSTPSNFVPVQIIPSHSSGLTLQFSNGLRLEGIHAENLALVRELVESLS